MFGALGLLAGCDVDALSEPHTGPALEVVEVSAVVVDAFGVETAVPLAPDGSTIDVSARAALRIRFDRFLAGDSFSRAAFCAQASTAAVDRPDECTQGRQFLEPAYDPVRQTVTLRLDPALDPEWLAQTRYTLSIFVPPADPTELGDYGVRAFDGASLRARHSLQFATGPAEPPSAVVPDRWDAYCLSRSCLAEIAAAGAVTIADPDCVAACEQADVECLSGCCVHKRGAASFHLTGCASSGCHSSASEGASAPAMGLDLSGPDGIRATALGRTAHETQVGEQASSADESPRRFGRAMPLVDPGSPGNSYLIYKLLASPSYATSSAAPSPDELSRLRDAVVIGMPMPARPPALDEAALDAISGWIAAGAPLQGCL